MLHATRKIGLLACSFGVTLLATQGNAQSFEDGIAAYQRGDKQAAVDAFKNVLASNPANEDAYRMWQNVEQDLMLQMLLERGELGNLADRFLEKAKIGKREVVADPGGAEDAVDALLNGDGLERQQAILDLRATYGSWAVPALVGPLGDNGSVDNRVHAIQALMQLGDAAVMPLTQVLHADSPTLRRNAASVLGSLGDKRAASGLAWMAANDDDDVSRAVAAEALDKLGMSGADPIDVTRTLALQFLTGDAEAIAPYDDASVIWEWADGELTGRPVLGGLHRFKVAEQLAKTALANGGGSEARAILAASHAAMKAEINAALEVDALSDSDLLAEAESGLAGIDMNLALAGSAKGAALELLTSDKARNVPAAAALMGAMNGGEAEVGALRAALGDADAAVSFAAANALAAAGHADQDVVAVLAAALSNVPDRVAVSIGSTGLDESGDGWFVLGTSSVYEGLRRARQFPPKDVIVLQDGVADVTLDFLIFSLREDPRTAETPIIVVTNDVDAVEGLYGDQVQKVVASATLADVAEVAGDADSVRGAAMARAKGAAETLSALPSSALAGVSAQVASALGAGADDDVLAAVLAVAGRAGAVDALAMIEALLSEDQPDGLRLAAMKAAASLYAKNGGQASGEAVDAIRSAVSGDGELASAAAAAMGQLAGVDGAELTSALR